MIKNSQNMVESKCFRAANNISTGGKEKPQSIFSWSQQLWLNGQIKKTCIRVFNSVLLVRMTQLLLPRAALEYLGATNDDNVLCLPYYCKSIEHARGFLFFMKLLCSCFFSSYSLWIYWEVRAFPKKFTNILSKPWSTLMVFLASYVFILGFQAYRRCPWISRSFVLTYSSFFFASHVIF